MSQYHLPLVPGRLYHVFSHAVGNEKLFKQEDNHRYFLEQFSRKTKGIVQLWAYCLLPNHFHMLVEILPEKEIQTVFKKVKLGKPYEPEKVSDFIMERFSNWLNGYTKAFNIKYKRRGALFIDYLRRVEIERDSQLAATVFYIHKNPVHHGWVKEIQDWKWSSYHALQMDGPTELQREKVLDWLGGKSGYLTFHAQPIALKHNGEMD